jgi:hypothetical protein
MAHLKRPRVADGRVGKILQDDKQISLYNIEEKGFIVCMVTKVGRPSTFRVSIRPLISAAQARSRLVIKQGRALHARSGGREDPLGSRPGTRPGIDGHGERTGDPLSRAQRADRDGALKIR